MLCEKTCQSGSELTGFIYFTLKNFFSVSGGSPAVMRHRSAVDTEAGDLILEQLGLTGKLLT